MSPTPDNPKPIRQSRWRVLITPWRWSRWTWAAIVPLMLMSYALSVGPVVWLNNHGYFPFAGLIETFYIPLEFACRRMPWLQVVVGKYFDWWRSMP